MKENNWPYGTWKELWKLGNNYVNVNSRERERKKEKTAVWGKDIQKDMAKK